MSRGGSGRGIAEDIVAETFLVAFRRRDSYDGSRKDARPWLYGIATNVIRRHRRDEVRALRALVRTGVDPVMAESFADRVDGRVSAGETSRLLAPALARLNAGQRDVLLLTAWAEFTLDQVAEVLGIPQGTARSRLNRARTKIRAALADTEHLRSQERKNDHRPEGLKVSLAGAEQPGPGELSGSGLSCWLTFRTARWRARY